MLGAPASCRLRRVRQNPGWQGQGDRSRGSPVRGRRGSTRCCAACLDLVRRPAGSGRTMRAPQGQGQALRVPEELPFKSGAFVVGFQVLARATPGNSKARGLRHRRLQASGPPGRGACLRQGRQDAGAASKDPAVIPHKVMKSLFSRAGFACRFVRPLRLNDRQSMPISLEIISLFVHSSHPCWYLLSRQSCLNRKEISHVHARMEMVLVPRTRECPQ